MKANTPALILYFFVCSLLIIFCLINMDWLIPYGKAIVIPAISYYYYVTNKYKVDVTKAVIFVLCFIGDIIFLMDFEYYFMTSLLCFFVVYMLLLRYFIEDFRRNKFRKIDILPISIVVILLGYLLITILNLKFDEAENYYVTFFLYGLTLAVLGCVCIMNYISKGTTSAIHAVIMFICFLLSDIFYLIANYYYDLAIFRVIIIGTQLFSYYFMVNYFLFRQKEIEHKYNLKIKNTI